MTTVIIDGAAPPWAADLERQINTALARRTVPSFTVERLPKPTPAGQIIYIPNESGGPTLAFSTGSQWLRTSDNAVVS